MTAPAVCPACHSPLAIDARYCHRCGRALTPGGSAERMPWIVAWGLVFLALGGITYFVVTKNGAQNRPDMANTGAAGPATGTGAGGAQQAGGAPPDISQMTPRERFLRLNDRIMSAAQDGDSATAQRFAPMAIAAYGMLDSYDPDVRFHVAEIHISLGQYAEALALADTIQVEAKDHLFADLLRAEVARIRGDRAALDRSQRAFLQHFDAQMATGRPEYQEHGQMLRESQRQFKSR